MSELAGHLCALYSNADERDAMLVPYLHTGLTAGHKCVCIIEAADQPAVVDALGQHRDLAVEECLDRGQLELVTVGESYLRRGTIAPEDMLDFWKAGLHIALELEGYDASFGAGDTAALGAAMNRGFDDFLVYEGEINRLVARSALTFMCLYDVSLLDGQVVQGLLRTHPKVLLNGFALENPHYQPVEEGLAARRTRAWRSLSDGERRVAELAAQGVPSGEIAVRLLLPRLIVDLNLHGVYRALDLSSHDELVRLLRDRPDWR